MSPAKTTVDSGNPVPQVTCGQARIEPEHARFARRYHGQHLRVTIRCPVDEKSDYRHFRLLRAPRERPRGSHTAKCGQQFPPSDGDCHTPLPCEVRGGKNTTSRACSLAVQGGQDAGYFDLSLRLKLHYSRRQLLANAAIAASRVAA